MKERGRNSISLESRTVARLGREATINALAAIGKSTMLTLDEDGTAFRLAGPTTFYHAYDADLPDVLARHWPEVGMDDVVGFHRARRSFDLCFEDGWTGLFAARALAARPPDEDLVLVHLDDHTDMMPTLLERRGLAVIEPATAEVFDPGDEDAWPAALASGAVAIGSFVTALCQGRRRVHVRHLNNVESSTYQTYPLSQGTMRHALVPDVMFATVRKLPPGRTGDAGSYRGGPDAQHLFVDLPAGAVLAHIDLDYLINDFNGNPDQESAVEDEVRRQVATEKLDRFFAFLALSERRIERWIIATSPGFCASRHWVWRLKTSGSSPGKRRSPLMRRVRPCG